MKHEIIIIIVLLVFIGCSKKDDNKEYNDILYTEVSPVKIIGFDNLPEHKGWFCDLNKDSVNDFLIGQGYWYSDGDPVPFAKSLSIHYVNWDSNFIYENRKGFLEKDEIISGSSVPWIDEGLILLIEYDPQYYYSMSSVTDKYFGLSVIKSRKKYFGWLNFDWDSTNRLLTVKGYAVQKIPNISIRAGQKN